MEKRLYLDMDGVLSSLYTVPKWLEKLRNEDYTPYLEAVPMVDMALLKEILAALRSKGYKIGVITWGSKEAMEDYDRAVHNAKIYWLQRHGIWQDVKENFHFLHYGIPKNTITCGEACYLVDDEERNRNEWNGVALDPTKDGLIEVLYELLEKEL